MKRVILLGVVGILSLAFIVVSSASAQNFKFPSIGYKNYCITFPSLVPKTGQKSCLSCEYGIPGDDGDLQKGVPWPCPRFIDNRDGTVTDRLTNLVWLKNMNCFGFITSWYDGLQKVNTLQSGDCGLTDGSVAGDWRTPNKNEIQSLVDIGNIQVPLPNFLPLGHPFTNVQEGRYWTSSTYAGNYPAEAWALYSYDGSINPIGKNENQICAPNGVCGYFFVEAVRDLKKCLK